MNADKLNASARVSELRQLLKAAAAAYYGDDAPIMSDGEYDDLMRELRELEAATPGITPPDSPSQAVGAAGKPTPFAPFTHPTRMYSLANAFDEGDMREFFTRMKKAAPAGAPPTYSAEVKLDGIAVNLLYENGALTAAATRGDGITGENVTANILAIAAAPTTLPDAPMRLEVRGEVVMRTADFMRLNDEQEAAGKKRFANPRNAAAGSLRQLDSSVTKSRPLMFYAHGIAAAADLPGGDSHSAAMEWLSARGFTLAEPRIVSADETALLDYHRRVEDERVNLPFDIDGVVYKIDNIAAQRAIGHTSRAPRFAIAYKFSAQTAISVINAIELQNGRTGILTPVARMKPTSVGGVIVSNATLHNIELIAEKDIRVCDTVRIRRAGDVIPEVIEALTDRRARGDDAPPAWQPPDACPACGGAIRRDERFLRCDNTACAGRRRAFIRHFVSRQAMDIDGFGDILLEKLLAAGYVSEAADIYRIGKKQLLSLDLIAETSADNLLAAIAASRQTTLSRLLFALGIAHVGKTTAEELTATFGGLENLMTAPAGVYAFIRGIGKETARALGSHFSDADNRRQIAALRDELTWQEDIIAPGSRPRPLESFLAGIGGLKQIVGDDALLAAIPAGLGKRAIGQLCAAYDDLPALRAAGVGGLTEALSGNRALAQSLANFLAAAGELIEALERLGFVWTNKPPADDAGAAADANALPLAGKTYVITGALEGMSRDEAKQRIEAAGGKVTAALSGNTDFLLAGEGGGGKRAKAQKLGVKIITQTELEAAMGAPTDAR